MKVIINNKANVPNKYVRYIKWRLYKLKSRFNDVAKAEVFFKTIGNSSKLYNVHINVQAKDNEFFISKADKNLDKIIKLIPGSLQHSLSNNKMDTSTEPKPSNLSPTG